MNGAKASRLRRVADGLWDFFVGDDWVLAVGVILVVILAALVATSVASWWVLIVGVPATLALSLRRATRL